MDEARETLEMLQAQGEDIELMLTCAQEAYRQMKVNKAFTAENDQRFRRAIVTGQHLLQMQVQAYSALHTKEAAGSLKKQMGQILRESAETARED